MDTEMAIKVCNNTDNDKMGCFSLKLQSVLWETDMLLDLQ